MKNTPHRRNRKIGRNDPCPCGSGRKFKHCHGHLRHARPALFTRDPTEEEIIEQGRLHFEEHKAREQQRLKQQGLGRPIISTEFGGFRFVAVGNKIHYGKWRSFPDFLSNYLKVTLGAEWGNAEISKPLVERHPLMQWYDKLCHLQAAQRAAASAEQVLFSTPMTGAVSGYYRLAYNLYLIAHNNKDIQTRLIDRLKNIDNFQGAFYETQVAAWLIKAGFELEYENEADGMTSHCEFAATYITGEKFSVEAKSRATRHGGAMRTPVVRQLRAALSKNAAHTRLVFIDLNKALHSQEEANRAFDHAEANLDRWEEQLLIDDTPAPSAYVCITNMNDLHALDSVTLGTMVLLRGFKIYDFTGVEFATIRDAARARERHLPMHKLLKSMEEHREIPQTFDGELPSEVFAPNLQAKLKIGQFYAIPGPDGVEISAMLTDATVGGDKASCVFHDPKTDRHFLVSCDMTPEELEDYATHPDTYFGAYRRQASKVKTAMDLYDFFVDSYSETSKDQLLELLKNTTNQSMLVDMSQKELVELLAERYTVGAIKSGFAVAPMRTRRKAHRN